MNVLSEVTLRRKKCRQDFGEDDRLHAINFIPSHDTSIKIMSALQHSARPLQAIKCTSRGCSVLRTFTSTTPANEGETAQVNTPSSTKPQILEPHLVHTPRLERKLLREKSVTPVGSRRRRAALQAQNQVPFEQLPYQCFQEARKILKADREEKLKQIEVQEPG